MDNADQSTSESKSPLSISLSWDFITEVNNNTYRVRVEQHPAIDVIGVAVRTNNANEMNGRGKIGEVWQKFIKQNVAAKIHQRVGNDIIAVYTDYDSDQNGEFTFLLGGKVSSVDRIPSGLVAKRVPAGRYAVVASNTGPLTQVVPEVWQRIWTMPPKDLGGSRAFLADYELYNARARDPQHAQVDVYVGLR